VYNVSLLFQMSFALYAFFLCKVEHDFSVKFIALYQAFLELSNRGDMMLITNNGVEIFASLFPSISTNVLVLVYSTTQLIS